MERKRLGAILLKQKTISSFFFFFAGTNQEVSAKAKIKIKENKKRPGVRRKRKRVKRAEGSDLCYARAILEEDASCLRYFPSSRNTRPTYRHLPSRSWFSKGGVASSLVVAAHGAGGTRNRPHGGSEDGHSLGTLIYTQTA